jgi:hypothetical protein
MSQQVKAPKHIMLRLTSGALLPVASQLSTLSSISIYHTYGFIQKLSYSRLVTPIFWAGGSSNASAPC